MWAGILARLHPSPVPSRVLPQWRCCRSRQAYSSGGCTGMAAFGSFTGFPFNARPGRDARTQAE
jgi:hypothetical protein